MKQELLQKESIYIRPDQVCVLVKPDALNEGCVPTILEMIYENGLLIEHLVPTEFSLDDGLFLYQKDLVKHKEDEWYEYYYYGAKNINGNGLVLAISSLTLESPADIMRRIKGTSADRNPRSIRGKVVRGRISAVDHETFIREMVKNRIHFPKNDLEQKDLEVLLTKKGFIFYK